MKERQTKTIDISITLPPRKTWMIIGTIIGLALGGAFVASAGDGNRATSNVANAPLLVPYEGFLMLDSSPLTADAQALTFRLFDAPQGGTELWTETQSVNVYAGRFSVGLGAVEPLTAIILDAEKVYLSIQIDDVQLSGRQAIEPVPYAAWSANSADMQINGKATVGNGSPTDVQLEIANSVAETGTINEFADYQLSLFRGGSPQATYGIGIQSRTMFFNVDSPGAYNFYGNGGNRRLSITPDTLDVDVNNLRLGSGNDMAMTSISNRLTLNPSNAAGSGVLIDSAAAIDGNLTFEGSNRALGGLRTISGNGTLTLGRQSGATSLTLDSNGVTVDSNVLNTIAVIGNPALVLRDSASSSRMQFNEGTGVIDVIANIDVSDNRTLNLLNDSDTSNANDGGLVIGRTNSSNISIDNNEILARNNGNDSTLFIQAEGGTAEFGGEISATELTSRNVTGAIRAPNGTANAGSVDVNNWADCGSNPIMAIRMVDPGGGLRMEVKCGR